MTSYRPPYLEPYQRAARKHGRGFESLLWASPRTQRTRFDAIRHMHDPAGKVLLDAGCGRADFLAYLIECDVRPREYIGIEAVDALASAAEAQRLPGTKILRADFIREPARLFVGADVVIFSGSLNTTGDDEFYSTLRRAYEAAGEALVFNFLCSAALAGQPYLYWRRVDDVLKYAESLCANVRLKKDYLDGDCTLCLRKASPAPLIEAPHA